MTNYRILSTIAIVTSLVASSQVNAFLSTNPPASAACINTRARPRLKVSFTPWDEFVPVDKSSHARDDSFIIQNDGTELGPVKAAATKFGMIMYIACMCIALPLTLFPTALLYHSNLISKSECGHRSLQTGEACAFGLLQAIPFLNLKVIGHHDDQPIPSIWTCNHTSMLDVFVLLASDEQLRGKNKRPLKAVYWKGLDENPITKLLFHMCGFIPVDMAANGSGVPNEYDRSSFKSMLKLTKQAFDDGFDVLVLPEGQLNPNPEAGLLPVFAGAYTLAKMSRRPIRMVALFGVHRLWRADESVGLMEQIVKGRDVAVRAYPPGKAFESGEDFVETFRAVVGHFGATGRDLPEEELQDRLAGRNLGDD